MPSRFAPPPANPAPELAFLLALWQAREQPISAPEELSLAPILNTLTHAGGCLIEQSPDIPPKFQLLRVGLPFWRDLLEYHTRQQKRLLGRRSLVYQQTASTNDLALEFPHPAEPIVFLTDQQRSGRGRRGTPWQARAGQSVLMSVLIPDSAWPAPLPSIETLTLRIGLACAEAVEQILGLEAEIKWPNDILLNGKKLAGILIEQKTNPNTNTKCTVIGIGLNVAQAAEDFPPDLRPRATSLYLARAQHHTSTIPDRLRVIDTLLAQIEGHCLNLANTHWLNDWKRRCHMLGRSVAITQGATTTHGHILDVDPIHGLVLSTPDGTTHFFPAQTSTLAPQL